MLLATHLGAFYLLFLALALQLKIGGVINKLCIGQLSTQPADRHPQLAGQKELKEEPVVLPQPFFASSRSSAAPIPNRNSSSSFRTVSGS